MVLLACGLAAPRLGLGVTAGTPTYDSFMFATQQVIDDLFLRLQGACGAWRQSWPNQKVMDASKLEWLAEFMRSGITSMEQIRHGMRLVSASKSAFVPAPGVFVSWCFAPEGLGLPGVETAYLQALRSSHPGMKIIALMGNVHAMRDPMTTSEGPLISSGALLSDLKPVSILITYPRGTIWSCMPDCKVHELTPRSQTNNSIGFKEGSPLGGYNFSYQLKSISASPPAAK